MKKLIALLLVMIMSAASLAVNAQTFTDVPDDHWAHDAISYFSDSGTIIGVGNDMFVPDEFITREEFAKLLSEIYAKTNYEITTQTFADVTDDMWSYNYIESVKEYLTGYYPENGAAFFNPSAKAAREDVAYALVKIIGLNKLEQADTGVLTKFEDANEISYHLKSYVAIAVSSGLMQGYDNYLRPQDGITRAETAALLFRAIKKPVADNQPEIILPVLPEPEVEIKTTENEKEESTQTNTADVKTEDTKTEDAKTEEVTDTKTEVTDKIVYKPKPNSVTAEKIYSVKITGAGDNNISAGRVDGYMSMIFDEDKPEDSEFVAEFIADGSRYYIKSTAVTNCRYTTTYGENIVVSLTYNVYKDDELILEGIKRTARMNRDNDSFELDGKAAIGAEALDWDIDVLPEKSEEEDDDKDTSSPWDDASSVHASFGEFSGEKASGMISMQYKTSESIAKAAADIKVGTDSYKIELASLTEMQADKITGTFNITCNGEIVAENISGELVNYSGKLLETLDFVCNDDKWNFSAQIVEVAN